jgi:hypothetical protein
MSVVRIREMREKFMRGSPGVTEKAGKLLRAEVGEALSDIRLD